MDQNKTYPNVDPENLFPTFDRVKDNIYFQPKKIEIKISHPEIGLGVFATDDIEEGELIERAPLIELDWRLRYQKDSQILKYVYTNSACKCEECKIHGPVSYIVLGYGSLYNHQDDFKAIWKFNFSNLFGDCTATKSIKKGEEIFVTYGERYFKNRKKLIL